MGNQREINLRFGYNITRRGDFGKHDNEEGGGSGFEMTFFGARTDLWFMDIDWKD